MRRTDEGEAKLQGLGFRIAPPPARVRRVRFGRNRNRAPRPVHHPVPSLAVPRWRRIGGTRRSSYRSLPIDRIGARHSAVSTWPWTCRDMLRVSFQFEITGGRRLMAKSWLASYMEARRNREEFRKADFSVRAGVKRHQLCRFEGPQRGWIQKGGQTGARLRVE